MNKTNGTPKTLNQAIINGGTEFADNKTIENHVKDFIRQKFGAAIIRADLNGGQISTAELFELLKKIEAEK